MTLSSRIMHIIVQPVRNAAGCQSRRRYSSMPPTKPGHGFKGSTEKARRIITATTDELDRSSPFYLPPASDPELLAPTKMPKLQDGYTKLKAAGFELASVWEQPIAWGNTDSFRHVNNVEYVRFFESARIQWMMSLGNELGGPAKAEAMVKGQGVSLILKSIEVQFRRPVTFPDTLLIASRPCLPDDDTKDDPTILKVTASAYSLAQGAFVSHSNETLVWYDYDKLKKCDPGDLAREAVRRTMGM